jgi:hypothetical protein
VGNDTDACGGGELTKGRGCRRCADDDVDMHVVALIGEELGERRNPNLIPVALKSLK